MDPLSLTASIIAVVQVSHAVLVCCYRIRGKVKGAEEEISHIINEVEDLTETLSELQELFEVACEKNQPLRVDDLPTLDEGSAKTAGEAPRTSAWESALATCTTILADICQKLTPFSRTGLKAKLSWPFESKSIESKLKLLEKQKTTLQLALTVFQARLTVRTQGQVTEIQDGLVKVHAAVVQGGDRVVGAVDQLRDEAKRLAILNWFKTSDPEQNHKISRAKHEPDTAKWIFHHDGFESWRTGRASGETLWLHGIPGAGKTILSSTVIDHLQRQDDATSRVIYYYFDFSDTKKQTVSSFLQSAVYQLISHKSELNTTISEPAAALFEKHNSGLSHATIGELVDVLFAEVSRYSRVFLVIDALDECPLDQRELFFDAFSKTSVATLALSLFITSRKEPDIESALSETATYTICLQGSDVDADVRIHVSNAISQDKSLSRWKPAIREEILEAIVEGSHGMFRWAVCQLDTIKKCLTPASKWYSHFLEWCLVGVYLVDSPLMLPKRPDKKRKKTGLNPVIVVVRAELKRMPPTLHQTYDSILLRVDEMHRPFVQSALRWLAFATRPLTLEELSEAAVVDPETEEFDPELSRLNDDSKILELCGTLVTSSRLKYRRGTDDWLREKVDSKLLLNDLVVSSG